MAGNRNSLDTNDRLFELLLNEISLTDAAIEHYWTFGLFWLGLVINFIVAYIALDTGNWNWIPIAIVLYSAVMYIECLMRGARAKKLEEALRSQLLRREFSICNKDENSIYATIVKIAWKRRRMVTPREATNATMGKGQDLQKIIQYACKHKYRG